MRMIDIINKKKNGEVLFDEEIAFWIKGVTDKTIPDYQTSALLMAICFRDLTPHETAVLTECMMQSGEVADLSDLGELTVDKHSTGGVGDKTTLVVAPLAAACGLTVAKMSGRGLGHTGGTVDKLESIPGFRTTLNKDEFVDTVKAHGLCVIAQSGNIAPADKELYALRDVTGTVNNIALIASSIMSKKLAGGAKAICLDVKCGSGAFMKDAYQAIELANAMVAIGTHHGRQVEALITDMDRPLGYAVGNAIEVREAVDTLRGSGPEDLTKLSLAIVTRLLVMTGHGDEIRCRAAAEEALTSGKALQKLKDMVAAQGGDVSFIDHPEKFPEAPFSLDVTAPTNGYIIATDTEAIGNACTMLGAGRAKKSDTIDMGAGMRLFKKTGDAVKEGDVIATLYASDKSLLLPAAKRLMQSIVIGDDQLHTPLIIAKVTKDGVFEA